MSIAVFLGDPHVGRCGSTGKVGIGSNLNSRIVDQFALLDWTLEKALEYHAQCIIITGDLFESPKPDPILMTMMLAWLNRCGINDIQIHLIIGNHDILRSGLNYSSSLDIIREANLEHVSIYNDLDTFIIDTTSFTMLPFKDRKSFLSSSNAEALGFLKDSLLYELSGIPSTYHKVLVGHLAIEGSIPVGDELDDLSNELFCPINMFNGFNHVWMGHIHQPQIMNKISPYVAHIGSMDLSSFGESNHKKHIVIFDCSNNTFKTEILPTRPLQKIVISVPKDTPDTTDYVIRQLEQASIQNKSIVRVEISLTAAELTSVNKTAIDKFLLTHGASSVNGISESKKIGLIKRDINNNIDTKMDVISAIKMYGDTYMNDHLRPAFIELAIELYNSYQEDH